MHHWHTKLDISTLFLRSLSITLFIFSAELLLIVALFTLIKVWKFPIEI